MYQRKFRGLPLHATERTLQATAAAKVAGAAAKRVPFPAGGEVLRFGKVAVETIPTPHNGVEGVAFVVDDGRHRLGILTDLGHVFAGLANVVASLDAMLLESNYDPQMLRRDPTRIPQAADRRARRSHFNFEAGRSCWPGPSSACPLGLPRSPLRRKQPPGAGAADTSAIARRARAAVRCQPLRGSGGAARSCDVTDKRAGIDKTMPMAKSRILIADDNPTNVELLEAYLAASLRDGRRRRWPRYAGPGAEFRPDLILLDIMMPKLSGFEVCEILRATRPPKRSWC